MSSKLETVIQNLRQFEEELRRTLISLEEDQRTVSEAMNRIGDSVGNAPGQVDRESMDSLALSTTKVQKAETSAQEAVEYINKVVQDF
jgi:flagellar hook-basal body complex protein FliE